MSVETKPLDVHLDMFEGPLDLLLFLIKKNDLNIYDIPIAQITQEYLSYLDLMKDLSLDVAGEFLVLAATLMGVKARTLLPEPSEEQPEGPDPRAELVAKLLEYQKFKAVAKLLEERAARFKDVLYREAPHFQESEKTLNINFLELLSSLREILSRQDLDLHHVEGEEFPIEFKIQKILSMLEHRASITLEDAFKGETKRRGILSCFLALLELVKRQQIFARQEAPFDKIWIYKKAALTTTGGL